MMGTTLHQMLQLHDHAVVLSASHDTYTHSADTYEDISINSRATAKLEALIKATGLHYYPVKGVYCDCTEDSFLVFCNDYYDISRIEIMGLHTFTQECVLILDLLKGCALLRYPDKVEHIGHGLVEIDEQLAQQHSNYSVIDNTYWIVE